MGYVRIELVIREESYVVERKFPEVDASTIGGGDIVAARSGIDDEIDEAFGSIIAAEKAGRPNG